MHCKSETIAYSVANPTTFICGNTKNNLKDWTTDTESRWSSAKTKYDPCPQGWRVPDGGASGVWSVGNKYCPLLTFDNKGFWKNSEHSYNFNGVLGDSDIWYPATGYRAPTGVIYGQNMYAMYWGVNEEGGKGSNMYFCNDVLILNNKTPKSNAVAVRCMKEGSYTGVPATGISLSESADIYLPKCGDSSELNVVITPANASFKYIDCNVGEGQEGKLTIKVDGTKITITRLCEADSEEPVNISVTLLGTEKYCSCSVWCCSKD